MLQTPLPSGDPFVITSASLNAKSVKDLCKLASRHGVPKWQSLKKEQLVKAILRATQSSAGSKPVATKLAPAKAVAAKAAAAPLKTS